MVGHDGVPTVGKDAENVDTLKVWLETNDPHLSRDVPLVLFGRPVGTLRLHLGKVFAAVSEQIRHERGSAQTRGLWQEEFDAPLSSDEFSDAISRVFEMSKELRFQSDLPAELYRESHEIAPAVNAGPAATLAFLAQRQDFTELASRRILRAFFAMGRANAQKKRVPPKESL